MAIALPGCVQNGGCTVTRGVGAVEDAAACSWFGGWCGPLGHRKLNLKGWPWLRALLIRRQVEKCWLDLLQVWQRRVNCEFSIQRGLHNYGKHNHERRESDVTRGF
eukprot:TRINITY_DN23792_c0_g1_i1.p1 TRINITY_DN23792_c0_g1~~TRINITY_DN23792_c0_g1_i1.p1  ORF type:complete len:106 (+),score=0.17 TRINITY_DN23792_c0_g1_i1:398-715(+)